MRRPRPQLCFSIGAAALLISSGAAAQPLLNTQENQPEEQSAPPGELPPPIPPRGELPKVELHGGAYFWYYQPVANAVGITPADNNIELTLASLEFEGRLDDFGLVLNPRFRDSEAREFFTSNVWIQQAYAYFHREYITAKVGKINSQLSPIWDDCFYGSLLYFEGFKVDSLYGISLEGSFDMPSGFGLAYYGQYFLIDGGTNGSLRDRDTVWVGGDVHRRHTTLGRVEPSFRFNKRTSLRLGAVAQYSYVDFTPEGNNLPPNGVVRVGGDVSFRHGPIKVFGEFLAQFGKTVTDYPIAGTPATETAPAIPGKSSAHNHYLLAGANFQIWRLNARYSFSYINYRDVNVQEILHLPGLTVNVHDNVALLLEYAYLPRRDASKKSTLDNSFNATVYARF